MNRDWRIKDFNINHGFDEFQELWYEDMAAFNAEIENKKKTESIQDEKNRLLEMKKLELQLKKMENEAESQSNAVSMQPFIWLILLLVSGAMFYLILKTIQQKQRQESNRNRQDSRTSVISSQI